ncbi:MAG: hypothetical protein JSS22_06430 [Proteobacteria bacterium]|nr:hypothetical protein [Pseudomonadota bacterium]
MMSIEEYVRLRGATVIALPKSFPGNVVKRIREIAGSQPGIGGGLSALDDGDNPNNNIAFRP